MKRLNTRVAIVGAGPGGLLLSHLLQRCGVDSIVLERRSREYVEKRVRAGLLEGGTVDFLREAGLADRLEREGLVHEGFVFRFGSRAHRMPFTELTGRTVHMYGQQELVKDLIRARTAAGARLWFDVPDVEPQGLDTDTPTVRCTVAGEPVEIACDFVAGCDGFHGVSRRSVPPGTFSTYERTYPYAWLGVLAEAPPAAEELIYAVHSRGFALHSMRSPAVSRLYLQVEAGERVENWPDERIWKELHTRLDIDGAPELAEGPVLEKSCVALRGFVTEPMSYGRLFLAGDAAHIVPPTAAKGLNLAVADVRVLAAAFGEFYGSGDRTALDGYSAACLPGVWQAQEFSDWMSGLLHRPPEGEVFDGRLRDARLASVVNSPAAARTFAENYVGLARERTPARGGRP
ncbi:4-hydroxybenzoate 3-monooxygenase [Streptomyces sp. 11-1-2]|uniref:4-hydroxybenzoate 3-monooxygenase n=1 Tax=unclassified Streptomyces TaxID=2593676 RepID=UPI001F09B133|nr:4-hydroxybenzoate 3-monooxygenase [Streptomyces sp. 11-1-2]